MRNRGQSVPTSLCDCKSSIDFTYRKSRSTSTFQSLLKNVSTAGILDVEAYALDLIKLGFSVDCIPILHIQAKHCKSFAVLLVSFTSQENWRCISANKNQRNLILMLIQNTYSLTTAVMLTIIFRQWRNTGSGSGNQELVIYAALQDCETVTTSRLHNTVNSKLWTS